jgi:hypothetical protein
MPLKVRAPTGKGKQMRNVELNDVLDAIASAIRETVQTIGLDALKRTSFFASNEREDNSSKFKEAA